MARAQLLKDMVADPAVKNRVMIDVMNEPGERLACACPLMPRSWLHAPNVCAVWSADSRGLKCGNTPRVSPPSLERGLLYHVLNCCNQRENNHADACVLLHTL